MPNATPAPVVQTPAPRAPVSTPAPVVTPAPTNPRRAAAAPHPAPSSPARPALTPAVAPTPAVTHPAPKHYQHAGSAHAAATPVPLPIPTPAQAALPLPAERHAVAARRAHAASHAADAVPLGTAGAAFGALLISSAALLGLGLVLAPRGLARP